MLNIPPREELYKETRGKGIRQILLTLMRPDEKIFHPDITRKIRRHGMDGHADRHTSENLHDFRADIVHKSL